MVRTTVNTASLVLLSLQKGAEHLAGESKEQQERLRNQTSKIRPGRCLDDRCKRNEEP